MTYSVLEMMKLAEGEEGEKKPPFLVRYATPIGFLAGTTAGGLLGYRWGAKKAPKVHKAYSEFLSSRPDLSKFVSVVEPDEIKRVLARGMSFYGGLAGGTTGALAGSLAKKYYNKKNEKEKTASVLDAVIVGPEKVAEQEQDRRSWLSRNKKKLLIGLGGASVLGAGAYGLSKTKVGQQIGVSAHEKGSWLLSKTKDLGIAGKEKGKAPVTKIRNLVNKS